MTAYKNEEIEPEAPNMRLRPPIVFLFAILAGFTLDHLIALPAIIPRNEGALHKLIPAVLMFLGLAIAIGGIRGFARAHTPVQGNRPSQALVTTGVHGWSRNPIYVGMIIFYVGIGVAVRSTWILALTPAIILLLRYAVIAREESYLEKRFGETYRAYRTTVRRWV